MSTKNHSPLRYPGGKSCLSDFLKNLVEQNQLVGGHYVELYAGGAGAALNLLFNDVVEKITINDYDYNIFCFWHSILNNTENFIKLIEETPINIGEWRAQKEIFDLGRNNNDTLLSGFSTFFLNRTNRSGIIFKAGPIGGLKQEGNYKIDVRFNKPELIKRIEKIHFYSSQISVLSLDAAHILENFKTHFPKINETFLYLDPPYYNKGKQLYLNNYSHEGHSHLSNIINILPKKLRWLISYDNVEAIRFLYKKYRLSSFDLNYTLQSKKFGSELLVFSDNLQLPSHITVNSRESLLELIK